MSDTVQTAEQVAANPLDLYRRMRLIRACEEHLARAHQKGLVLGACHTYVGQEAIAVGVCAALAREDVIFSTHRGHGHALAKGLDPALLMAELYGRAGGCSRGRGGSMHLFAPEIGLLGTSGIVGPSILQATGAAYCFQLRRLPHIAVAFFGDGAVNNGAFHEGLNLAAIWKLPVLFICENNQYATEVAFDYSAANPDVGGRATHYGMPGLILDGNDVRAVHEAARQAVDRARAGGGPALLECRTYRTRPHAEGMGDFTYRTKDEVEQWKRRCPIEAERRRQIEAGEATALMLDQVDAEVTAQIEMADQQAIASPWPDPETATQHVFAEPRGEWPRPEPPAGSRSITQMQATLEALDQAMAGDERIFVLGEGIGVRGGNFRTTAGLFEKYGASRLRDTPICERGFVGVACGAAMAGARPVVDFMFADFLLDAMGEVVNQIAKIRYMSSGRIAMPMVLRGCIGIGHSAATHHSGSYLSMFGQIPGLRVVVPSTPYDAKGLFARALAGEDPVLFLEHREVLSKKGPVPAESYQLDFGRAAIVRPGRDATLVAMALMVSRAVEVADRLAQSGINIEIIDPRTVAPLDMETILGSVARTGRLLIVDESPAPFGMGAEIAARVVADGFDELDAPIRRLNGAFAPTPYSPPLEAAVVPSPLDIERAIRDLLEE